MVNFDFQRVYSGIKKFGIASLVYLLGVSTLGNALALPSTVQTILNLQSKSSWLKSWSVGGYAQSASTVQYNTQTQDQIQLFTYCVEPISADSFRAYFGYINNTGKEVKLKTNDFWPKGFDVQDPLTNQRFGSQFTLKPGKIDLAISAVKKVDNREKDLFQKYSLVWRVQTWDGLEAQSLADARYDVQCRKDGQNRIERTPQEIDLYVSCVDRLGESFNGVIGYRNNTGSRIELTESKFDKERKVIHSHFDQKLDKYKDSSTGEVDYTNPNLAKNLSGPVSYLMPGEQNKAMIVEGVRRETIKWSVRFVSPGTGQEMSKTLQIAEEFYPKCANSTTSNSVAIPNPTPSISSAKIQPQITVLPSSLETESKRLFHPQLAILPYLEPIPNTIQFPLSNNTQILGTLDFYTYCRNKYSNDYTENLVNTNGVNIWTCYNQNLNDYQSIDANDTCKVQYQNQQAYVIYNDHLSPFTWECGVEFGGGNGGNQGGGGSGGVGSSPIEPVGLDYENAPDKDIFTEEDIKKQDYEVRVDINSEIVWLLVEEINSDNLRDLNNTIFGPILNGCSASVFYCLGSFSSAFYNMAVVVAHFISGILQGIGQAVIGLVDVIKAVLDLGNTLQGVVTMISQLFKDPSVLGLLIFESLNEYKALNIFQKYEYIGKKVGEFGTDLAIGLVSGSVLVKLGSKIASIVGGTLSKAKVAITSINVAEKLVNKTVQVSKGVYLTLQKVAGKVVILGQEMAEKVLQLSDDALYALLKYVPDGKGKELILEVRRLVNYCRNVVGVCLDQIKSPINKANHILAEEGHFWDKIYGKRVLDDIAFQLKALDEISLAAKNNLPINYKTGTKFRFRFKGYIVEATGNLVESNGKKVFKIGDAWIPPNQIL